MRKGAAPSVFALVGLVFLVASAVRFAVAVLAWAARLP
jgi:hypothetical protein